MHTISVEKRNDEYRYVCSCGSTGNWYGTSGMAMSTGLGHKTNKEGLPNNADSYPDDPHMGW
jgi:hypothetical protein